MADTDHLNRIVDLPGVVANPDTKGQLLQRVSITKGPIRVTWREHPFEWVKGRSYSVRRDFENGPFLTVVVGVLCHPRGGGSEFTLFAEITPRYYWSKPILSALVGVGLKKMIRIAETFDSNVQTCALDPTPRNFVDLNAESQLQTTLLSASEPAPVSETLWGLFKQLLTEGTDEEVLLIRPYALAHRWQQDRKEVLKLFFWAARNAILQLQWVLICPNCRVPKNQVSQLSKLDRTFHCDFCGVDYGSELDTNTELRFSVSPQIRKAVDTVYCIGSPMRMPHILAQAAIQPGQVTVINVALPAIELRLRVLKYNRYCRLVCGDEEAVARAQTSASLHYNDEKEAGWKPQAVLYRPGEMELKIHNRGKEPIVVALEKVGIDPFILSAAEATRFWEFRDLFGSEVLGEGIEVGVRTVAILFTDLKGSTVMYEQIGDAPAFGMVRRHFDFLNSHITRHEGTTIKTAGDAVMAAFPSAAHALRAAMAIQSSIDTFSSRLNLEFPVVLKMGLHVGPAIAMTANGRLDYFGRTVNLAARIQHESRGADIVFSKEILRDSTVKDLIQSGSYEERTTTLRGVPGKMTLCHWKANRLITRLAS